MSGSDGGAASRRRRDGRHPIARLEQRVEAPQALEAARQRDVGDRQRGVGQQALGEQQPLRLRVLDRRDAELGEEDAPQMTARDADARGEMLRCPPSSQRAVLDQVDRACASRAPASTLALPGRELGTAAQARPIAVDLGRRRAGKEAAVLALRRAHRAHRAAVDARRAKRRRKSVRRSAGRAWRARGNSCRDRVHGADYAPHPDRGLAVFGHRQLAAIVATDVGRAQAARPDS